MHNFVLACPSCNRSKSDSLAAKIHLDKWMELTSKNSEAIARIGERAGVSPNLETSIAIAKWGYEQSSQNNADFWVAQGRYEKLSNTNL
jgi:hypothetical protein